MRRRTGPPAATILCVLVFTFLPPAQAKALRIAPPRGNAGPGMVNLPYTVNDSQGNQWMFYQYGQFQQQGNASIYSQGAMLQINGNYPQTKNNQAKIDDKTGEVIFENMAVGGLSLTRRIFLNKEEGFVRYIDIIKNTTAQEQTANLNFTTNLNYGVQVASMVPDPKRKDQNLAWVAQTNCNGRTAVDVFAGKAAKTAPLIAYQPGNNQMQATLSPRIAAGKEIALLHFHCTTTSPDTGTKFVLDMKDSKLMATIPSAIRKLIVNFRGGENFVGDYEILRGEVLDVVELRAGDQLKGTLKEQNFKLDTFYGKIELPIDKVIGMINVGEFRPRQLIVTKDGEIFGGRLEREKLSLELSSGQVTEIPIAQISRMGYRKRSGEPEEWVFDKPTVLMRAGDRIGVRMPSIDIDVITRYGALKLKPETVAAIGFQSEDQGVHEIFLTDGSHFAGLATGDVFEMKLASEGPEQVVKFPASSIRRLQLAPRPDEPDGELATLTLANEDMLVGALAGNLKLDTAFNTIALSAGEIRKMVHLAAGSPSDVQVVLWDETAVSGQLQEQEVTCQLKSGLAIKVPVALVQEYNQPHPLPSAAAIETIKGLVADLNADDWQKRDLAQEKLANMGQVVISTLKELRPQQSPEGQQRIDAILKQLAKSAADSKPGNTAASPMPVPMDQ